VLLYVYVGYSILIRMLASAFGRKVRRDSIRPAITVVIAAFNEEVGLRAKLDNVLALDYPEGLLDVIVVSDASTDSTDQIVRSYESARVRLLRIEGRQGKTACQNAGAAQATGEIIVFTDATTTVGTDALVNMVANFADPDVGCVAGTLVYEARGANATGAGGTSYWEYEIMLRRAESRLGTLVGVSGCLYGVRRIAYRPIDPTLISDFVVAMRMREQGLRTVLEPSALCFEETLDKSDQELAMRIRVAIRSINALVSEWRFLNPLIYPVFAWQLWSHKLLRYLSPYFCAGALLSSLALAGQPFYRVAFGSQLLVIVAGFAGFAFHAGPARFAILNRPYYFILTNLASLMAAIRYLAGERMVTWKPVR